MGSAGVLHYTVAWATSRKTDLGSDTTVVHPLAQPHSLWASLFAGEIFDHCMFFEIPFQLKSFDPQIYWGRKDTSPLWLRSKEKQKNQCHEEQGGKILYYFFSTVGAPCNSLNQKEE